METNHSQTEQFIQKVTKIIEENIANENFTVEELAHLSGLSRSMLHRKLIKATGKSASDLITDIRIKRAKELLENDVATVAEIAYSVGFRSPSYFNKVFKKHYHVSPGEVRKKSVRRAFVNDASNITIRDRFMKQFWRNISIVFAIVFVLLSGVIAVTSKNHKEKSVAVLPLANLTGEIKNDFITAGIHDALIGELGNIGSLRVISRTSTLRYNETDKFLKDIAQELNVNFIVEASLIKVADSVRLLVQVIDVFPKEDHLMATEYYDDFKNILNIQASVVHDIVGKINVKLNEREEKHLEQVRKVNPEVYKAYLRGMYHLNLGTPEDFEKGLSYLLQAIDMDPADPFAYAALALGYAIKGHGQSDPKEAFNRAVSAAETAIQIDPTIDEAYTALALIHLYKSWNWEKAREAFEEAIQQNPNNAIAHAHFAWYWLLFNDNDKAIEHAYKASELNPLYVSFTAWLALLYFNNEQFAEAEETAKKALLLNENAPYPNLVLGWINLEREDYPQAFNYYNKLPNTTYYDVLRAHAYMRTNQREKALGIWEKLQAKAKKRPVNACAMGRVAAILGYTDLAFEYLNEAIEKKQYPITYLNFYPCFKVLENDPRFNELFQKLNLPNPEYVIASK